MHISSDDQTKYLCAGLLAHVDSGKTTLSEAMLYRAGAIRSLGRVDHGDAFLDTDPLEKKRGITIFSKQAMLRWKNTEITLLDTPGHGDFSAETERVLSVLDCGILVVSGSEGVQSHTETLWKLLKRRGIPVLVFVNKMDISHRTRAELLEEMENSLGGTFVDMTGAVGDRNGGGASEESSGREASQDVGKGQGREASQGVEKGQGREALADALAEDLARASEGLTRLALEDVEKDFCAGQWRSEIAEAVEKRELFPVVFGSALRLEGIDVLIDMMDLYFEMFGCQAHDPVALSSDPAAEAAEAAAVTVPGSAAAAGRQRQENLKDQAFGARVFKIARDDRNARLTFMRITSGTLRVRDQITDGEKVSQIRVYSGEKFNAIDEALPGQVVSITGLNNTYEGQGLGVEEDRHEEVLEPFMDYVIRPTPDQGVDDHRLMEDLEALTEEDPKISPRLEKEGGEIHISLMGEIQLEILKEIFPVRFGYEVELGTGRILYRETVASIAEGVGHFEPLRHYAEVHLVLQPGEPGSGLVFRRACSTDELDLNWQRLILTHLGEKTHRGTLIGAPLTDTVITVVGGKAHKKHTEGGDFRQATYRALRCGLMKAGCRLLEPWMDLEIRVPTGNIGRVMADLDRMGGEFGEPENEGDISVIRGMAPASGLLDYQKQIIQMSKGRGRMALKFRGYEPCHDQEKVVDEAAYDPEQDLENTPDSVFCSHGSGEIVRWRDVEERMAVPPQIWRYLDPSKIPDGVEVCPMDLEKLRRSDTFSPSSGGDWRNASDKELMEIFRRTYGSGKKDPLARGRDRGPGRAGEGSFEPPRKYRLDDSLSRGIYGSGRGRQICIMVDGYNVMNAWPELKEMIFGEDVKGKEADARASAAPAQKRVPRDYGPAREQLVSRLMEYQGFTGYRVILVFDAYNVEGGLGSRTRDGGLEIVYTRENETADAYIQQASEKLARQYDLWVISSDTLVQQSSFGHGALRMSSMRFLQEVQKTESQINSAVEEINSQTD